MKKLIVIVFVVIIALVAVVLLIKGRAKNNMLDGTGMEYAPAVSDITYFRGADEYGRSTEWHLHDWQLDYNRTGGANEEPIESHCDVAIDFYNSLDAIIDKYNMKSCTDLASSEIEISDGEKTTVTIEFSDGTAIMLGDNYQMPESAWNAICEITELFESFIEGSAN